MATKKPSGGGARASARIRAEQAAARGEDYRRAEVSDFANLGPAPADPEAMFVWAAQIAARALEGAATDPGLTPEAAREQIVRLVPQVVKAADPARLAAKITALETALAEMAERTKDDAADDARREDRSPRAGASLS